MQNMDIKFLGTQTARKSLKALSRVTRNNFIANTKMRQVKRQDLQELLLQSLKMGLDYKFTWRTCALHQALNGSTKLPGNKPNCLVDSKNPMYHPSLHFSTTRTISFFSSFNSSGLRGSKLCNATYLKPQ